MNEYVHGYSARETQRLQEQSEILEDLLHSDTHYPAGSKVLEAGCGVGGQTVILAKRSPEANLTSIDISEASLDQAKDLIEKEDISNIVFQQANIMDLPFNDESFDHVFICFVLEHLSKPLEAIVELKRVLKKNGSLTIIEGDHGSCFWHPETPESLKVWNCMIRSQKDLGHDPLIGRRVYPLLQHAGFNIEYVAPKWAYTDSNSPDLTNGAINKIIVPMTQTTRDQSLKLNLINPGTWEKGIRDLEEVALNPNGTFFYTWFKGVATK